jgi:hypothetical protein
MTLAVNLREPDPHPVGNSEVGSGRNSEDGPKVAASRIEENLAPVENSDALSGLVPMSLSAVSEAPKGGELQSWTASTGASDTALARTYH